jgi:hypothetical protein
VQYLPDPAQKANPLNGPCETNLILNKEKSAMSRSKSSFNRIGHALAGAFFLLALIVAGTLGITRVYDAGATINSTEMAKKPIISVVNVKGHQEGTANGAAELIKEIVANIKTDDLEILFRMDSGYVVGRLPLVQCSVLERTSVR